MLDRTARYVNNEPRSYYLPVHDDYLRPLKCKGRDEKSNPVIVYIIISITKLSDINTRNMCFFMYISYNDMYSSFLLNNDRFGQQIALFIIRSILKPCVGCNMLCDHHVMWIMLSDNYTLKLTNKVIFRSNIAIKKYTFYTFDNERPIMLYLYHIWIIPMHHIIVGLCLI